MLSRGAEGGPTVQSILDASDRALDEARAAVDAPVLTGDGASATAARISARIAIISSTWRCMS